MATLIAFILVLGILVFVHEMGHFLAAKKFGVKSHEFGLGFPPRIVGYYKTVKGKWKKVWGSKDVKDAESTVYSLNWIPLGGFVKIKGENRDAEGPDSFNNKKIWKRSVILSAGVGMNILLAMVLLIIGLMAGLPQVLQDLPEGAQVQNRQLQVLEVVPDSPAEEAGLRMGDVIVSIDGYEPETTEELQTYVSDKAGEALSYDVMRGNEMMTKEVTPVRLDAFFDEAELKNPEQAGIGVSIAEIGIVKYPIHLAIWHGIKSTFALLWAIISGLAIILARLFSGQGAGEAVAGPVGIASLTGQMLELGWIYLLQFTAILSLNLAIINILPIPALDGGRLVFLAIEKVKGSPVKQEVEAWLHNIFFILLLLAVALVTFNDISNLGCITCKIGEFFNN